MQRQLVIFLLFIPFLYGFTSAQDIRVTADYPRVVAVGETFRISFTVNHSGGEMRAPSLREFYRLSGPHVAYSQSMSIINGRRSTETSYTYTYQLQALSAGKFEIGKAVFIRDNVEYESDSIAIEVVPDAGGRLAAGRGEESQEAPVGAPEMFVRFIPEKSEVYIGEPVVAIVKLYTRSDISGISEVKYPSFTGFLKEDLETPRLTSLDRENIDGVVYGTGVLQRYLLYPQRTGEIEIDPVQLTVQIRERSQVADPFFGDFFRSITTVPRVVKGESVIINVLPLPGGRPSDFKGGVGRFSIFAETERDTLTVNDAVKLKVTLEGRGNLRLAEPPVIVFPEGVEVFDPGINLRTNRTTGDGKSGSKVFEYLIIPRSAGSYTIGPVKYSWFDPQEQRYITMSTDEILLEVIGSDVTYTTVSQGTTTLSGEVRQLARDIRFIRIQTGPLKRGGGWLISSRSYYPVFAIALLMFAAVIFLRREQVKRSADRAKMMNRKAGRVARRRLKEARRYMSNNDADRFFEEILRAIWGYAANKLNIPSSDVTRERVLDAFKNRGVDDSLTKRLEKVADNSEFARYSSEKRISDMHEIYSETTEIIETLEDIL